MEAAPLEMMSSAILISCVAMCLHETLCAPFPEVSDAVHVNVRLRNLATDSYLSVGEGTYHLGTKRVVSTADPDGELFYFTMVCVTEMVFRLRTV